MNTIEKALRSPSAYPHRVAEEGVKVVETHISWVFLTGAYAYKLKKPVDLGFLDFSTPEKRRLCCLEELRLNRRLCPDLYLEVLPVTATEEGFRVGGDGPAADHVVRMVQFDRACELDRLLASGKLSPELVDDIGKIVAGFHRSAPPADPSSPYGLPDTLLAPMLENLDRISALVGDPEEASSLRLLRNWTLDERARLEPVLLQRKREGFIRECHGDMHTGNMVIWNGKVMIFDCIEFNRNLSVIDIMSDAAFLFMDLAHAGRGDLAWRFLNGYLSETGDYGGLRVLRIYCAYRAMVRAKVTAIRLAQQGPGEERDSVMALHRSYIDLSLGYIRQARPILVVMHGVSGTGKSWIASRLAEAGGFVHLRSDVERKRLFGIPPLESSRSTGIDIYSSEASDRTYERLLEATEASISGGWPVIVDATFLRRRQRTPFVEIASRMGCALRILSLHAPPELLRERVRERAASGKDPSEADLAVLESQLSALEPVDGSEAVFRIDLESAAPIDHDGLAARLIAASQG